MYRRLYACFLLLASLIVLAGCSQSNMTAPATSQDDYRPQQVWQQLQREIAIDPTAPSFVEDFRVSFSPDGKLKDFILQVRAKATGDTDHALFQVEGHSDRWLWFKVMDHARPTLPPKPPAAAFFAALDQAGFPKVFLKDTQASATFYDFKLVIGDQPVGNAATTKAIEHGKLRDWTVEDTKGYTNKAIPILRLYEMVTVSTTGSRTESSTVSRSDRLHDYMIIDAMQQ